MFLFATDVNSQDLHTVEFYTSQHRYQIDENYLRLPNTPVIRIKTRRLLNARGNSIFDYIWYSRNRYYCFRPGRPGFPNIIFCIMDSDKNDIEQIQIIKYKITFQ